MVALTQLRKLSAELNVLKFLVPMLYVLRLLECAELIDTNAEFEGLGNTAEDVYMVGVTSDTSNNLLDTAASIGVDTIDAPTDIICDITSNKGSCTSAKNPSDTAGNPFVTSANSGSDVPGIALSVKGEIFQSATSSTESDVFGTNSDDRSNPWVTSSTIPDVMRDLGTGTQVQQTAHQDTNSMTGILDTLTPALESTL